MKPLIIIPAREGSKGIPRKNIKLLNGKPLILYTLEIAREIFDQHEICVSTDSLEIKKVIEAAGQDVPFLRPGELASDTSGTRDVILHAVRHYSKNYFKPDFVILLQPTSPFRSSQQIKDALKLYHSGLDMVVSVKESKSNPYFTLKEESEDGWLVSSKPSNFIRRQDCPKTYELNGSIYIINLAALKTMPFGEFKKVKKFIMDEESSVDIDNNIDWLLAETILNNRVDEG